MTTSKSDAEKAWARYWHDRFDNVTAPKPLVMLAIKDAFRYAFEAGRCANDKVADKRLNE